MIFMYYMRKLLFFLFAVALFCGCSRKKDEDKRPVLVVSIEPYRYFVNQVAGERFKVISLVPGNSSPETYEPTPQQMLELMNSSAYLSSGYIDFERTRLRQITKDNPAFPLFNLSSGIKTLRDSDGDGVDPHVWLSPRNVKVIAQNICSALCIVDSVNSDEYKQRAAVFIQHIDSIDEQIQHIAENLTRRSFLIYHPTLTYFANDYGLLQLPISAGGKEASPAHIETLLLQSKTEMTDVLFVQKQFPASSVRQIAHEAKVRIVEIDPLAYEWDREMILIAKRFSE